MSFVFFTAGIAVSCGSSVWSFTKNLHDYLGAAGSSSYVHQAVYKASFAPESSDAFILDRF